MGRAGLGFRFGRFGEGLGFRASNVSAINVQPDDMAPPLPDQDGGEGAHVIVLRIIFDVI